VRIEQAIDEVEIARPARPGAYREPAGDLRLTRGRKRGDLLMPDMNPVDRLALAQCFGQAVQAVPDHAEYALHAGLNQRFRNEVGDSVDLHIGLALSEGASERLHPV
jgi:hypothetical protein